jgi:glycogen phosphorylase
VLYPDDTTYQGKELRLKQEFFLTSAALQDILRRYLARHRPARAAEARRDPDERHASGHRRAGTDPPSVRRARHALRRGAEIARACLGYTNHTLLPEALERWATFTFGNVLPRHMQIVERIDSWHRRAYPNRPHYVGIVKHQEVRMGELAFIMSHKVNGVSALHSDLVKQNLFPELNRCTPAGS